MNEYNASSIRVLKQDEAIELFDFARADALAQKYTYIASECISRLLTACRLSGTDIDAGVRRYLDHDKSVEVGPELADCYAELVREAKRNHERRKG